MRLSIAAALACVVLSVGTPGAAQTALGRDVATEQAEFEAILSLLEADPAAGLAALEIKAATGDAEYLSLLGVVLNTDQPGLAADPVRAESVWRRAIAAGSDSARQNLGSALLVNDDPADDTEAVALLEAITNPDVKKIAAYNLGRAYIFGRGAPVDLTRGSTLILQAADAFPDNLDARFLAGRALSAGWGIEVDPVAARGHFQAAADGGDPRAQWSLGMMLLNGEGGPADAEAAYRYVRRAAEAGHPEGQVSLAVMLALGQGVTADPAQARQWYRRAAERGNGHALRGLGGMLLVGEGGDADPVTGAAYLELAAEAGDETAATLLERFQAELAALDRAAVEAVKADWIARRGRPRI